MDILQIIVLVVAGLAGWAILASFLALLLGRVIAVAEGEESSLLAFDGRAGDQGARVDDCSVAGVESLRASG